MAPRSYIICYVVLSASLFQRVRVESNYSVRTSSSVFSDKYLSVYPLVRIRHVIYTRTNSPRHFRRVTWHLGCHVTSQNMFSISFFKPTPALRMWCHDDITAKNMKNTVDSQHTPSMSSGWKVTISNLQCSWWPFETLWTASPEEASWRNQQSFLL